MNEEKEMMRWASSVAATTEAFIVMVSMYLDLPHTTKAAVSEMIRVYKSDSATENEARAALETIIEALFPKRPVNL